MITKKNYQLHQKDTGSTALQIISLNAQIQQLVEHGNRNRKVNFNEKRKKERWKDVPAKRALLKKIAKEKRFFQYLKKHDPNVYESLKKELNLKIKN